MAIEREKLSLSQIMAKSFDEWTPEEAELMRKHEEYIAKMEQEKAEKKAKQEAEARNNLEEYGKLIAHKDRADQQRKELRETNPVAYFLQQVNTQVKRPSKLPLTAEQATQMLRAAYQAQVASRGRKPELMVNIEPAIQTCARWLTDSSTKPGLILQGNVGTGKTTLLYAIKMVVEAMDQKKRKMEIEGASAMVKTFLQDIKRFDAWVYTPLLGIDDLGTEAVSVKDYGNDKTPMGDLLLERYRRLPFTIITTNLTKQQLLETYGERVESRLSEWCGFMAFGTKTDYRKTNGQTEMFNN